MSAISPRFLASTMLALALTTAPALAQTAADGPVATAAGQAAPPAPTPSDVKTTGQSGPDPADPSAAGADDRKPHGYIDVAVGNRGYREVSGAVTLPVGKTGQATIAIGDEQGDGWRR
jgi:hypothetical protein